MTAGLLHIWSSWKADLWQWWLLPSPKALCGYRMGSGEGTDKTDPTCGLCARKAGWDEVLTDADRGRYGQLVGSERVVMFGRHDSAEHTVNETLLGNLLDQGYLTAELDTVDCSVDGEQRSVAVLGLLRRGRELLGACSTATVGGGPRD